MTRFAEHALWFAFTSERFANVSELPRDANAGNRFYGRDVAEFICAALGQQGIHASVIEEDWGWQAHGMRDDGSVIEVSVYHNPEQLADGANDWVLMVRLLRRQRVLGRLHRFREVEVDQLAVDTITTTFASRGIALRRNDA